MTLHAIQDIEDAFAATREFLLPIEPRQWAKLALVVFFIGAGTGMPFPTFDASFSAEGFPDQENVIDVPDDIVLVAAILVAVAVAFALVWAVVGAIMEFVLIESLRSREVALRRYWGRRWRQGLGLFAFRLALVIPLLALVAGWLALVLVPVFTDLAAPGWAFGLFLLGIPAVVVLGVAFGLVYMFTTAFVVPIMVKDDCGVLAAWRRLWPSLKAEWKQYLLYAVFSVVLTFVAGLPVTLILGFIAVLLLIPFALVGIAAYLALSFSSVAGLAVLGVLVAGYFLVLTAAWAFVQVPVVAYLRYYALLVLGDIEESFDLVPEQRAAIRAD